MRPDLLLSNLGRYFEVCAVGDHEARTYSWAFLSEQNEITSLAGLICLCVIVKKPLLGRRWMFRLQMLESFGEAPARAVARQCCGVLANDCNRRRLVAMQRHKDNIGQAQGCGQLPSSVPLLARTFHALLLPRASPASPRFAPGGGCH